MTGAIDEDLWERMFGAGLLFIVAIQFHYTRGEMEIMRCDSACVFIRGHARVYKYHS